MLDAEQIENWEDILVDTGFTDFDQVFPHLELLWPDPSPGVRIFAVKDIDVSIAGIIAAGLKVWAESGIPLRIKDAPYIIIDEARQTAEDVMRDWNIRKKLASLR